MDVRHHSVKRIHIKEFKNRLFPLVLLVNGKPGYVINQWIYYLIENGITESLLNEHIRSLTHLYDYTVARYGEKTLQNDEAERLIYNFLLAKKNGTHDSNGVDELGLNWKPLPRDTVIRYLNSLNKFDKWQSTFHYAERLNPSEIKLLDAWEVNRKFKTKTKFDVLLHLFPTKEHTKESHKWEVKNSHNRFTVGSKKIPKAFPLNAFVNLVEYSSNPRDKMLWLIMFGLGMRMSEPLHLFLDDYIGTTDLGEARIRLDDPEVGEFRWHDNCGVLKRGSRWDYLDSEYRNSNFKTSIPNLYTLEPRTQYGGNRKMFVGFKGMNFDVSEGGLGNSGFGFDAEWIDFRVGIYFRRCLEEYLDQNFYEKPLHWPFHPWLFINVDNNDYGMPMTRSSLAKAWARAVNRIGLNDLVLGTHSLRHLAGYYCASVLKLSIEETKSLLRHSSVVSTEVYYHVSKSVVRDSIRKAIMKGTDYDIKKYIVLPGAPKLDIPEHWYN